MDNAALFKISYGLYVLTARDSGSGNGSGNGGDSGSGSGGGSGDGMGVDNGCVINTVLQVTSVPPLVGVVSVNKQNRTHDMIMNSKKFNVSALSTDAPFEVFKHFGFQSGKTADKFADYMDVKRSENGILYLTKYVNSYLSFNVSDTIDFGTHTLFKADITDGEVLSGADSVTYTYYQQHIKPKPQPAPINGYRCNICAYFYEGDSLPADFICPICKHGASDFVKAAS